MVGNASAVDLLRVLVLLMGAGVVSLSVMIMVIYGRAYLMFRKEPGGPAWLGLLPAHVALISASYLILVVSTMLRLVSLIHEGVTWRLPTYGAAYFLGLWALWLMLGHTRHRWRGMHEAME